MVRAQPNDWNLHSPIMGLTALTGALLSLAALFVTIFIYLGPLIFDGFDDHPRYIAAFWALSLGFTCFVMLYTFMPVASEKVRRTLWAPFSGSSTAASADRMDTHVVTGFFAHGVFNITFSLIVMIFWSIWWHQAKAKPDSDLWNGAVPAWASLDDVAGFYVLFAFQLISFALYFKDYVYDMLSIMTTDIKIQQRIGSGIPMSMRRPMNRATGFADDAMFEQLGAPSADF